MTSEELLVAIGEIDDDKIQRAHEKSPKHHIGVKWGMIAACVLLMLNGAVAEATYGNVSNLLAPIFGGARTEIIDCIGKPVGASVTMDGFTITADAVIGDRHNLAIVYTLTRDDGEALPEHLEFEDYHNSAQNGSGSLVFGIMQSDSLPENQAKIVVESEAESPIFWHHANVSFQNLRVPTQQEHEYETIAEGPWNLSFALRYIDTTANIPLNGELTVYDKFDKEYRISKLQISSFAVQMKLTAPNPRYPYNGNEALQRAVPPLEDFLVFVKLSNGEVLNLRAATSTHGVLDEPTLKARYNGRFPEPLLTSEIDSLIICDTEIPVNLR